jgi:hypothetical protein
MENIMWHFETTEVFQMAFDIVIMQHTVEQTNKYAWQYVRKSVAPFIFCFRLKEWQDVIVDQMYHYRNSFT